MSQTMYLLIHPLDVTTAIFTVNIKTTAGRGKQLILITPSNRKLTFAFRRPDIQPFSLFQPPEIFELFEKRGMFQPVTGRADEVTSP